MVSSQDPALPYRRPQAAELARRLAEPRRFIQVIAGPRQVGKSTLVTQAVGDLPFPVRFVSADEPSLRGPEWIATQWEAARLETGPAGAVLVIDEVQKAAGWSESVKRLWDEDTRTGLPLRVVLLGSAPLLVEQGLTESVAGRFEVIRVPHWSLAEMRAAFGISLDEYVFFGGYPGAAPLIGDESRWRRYILDALIETTISRDVLLLTRVDKPALLRRLFELGCRYCGAGAQLHQDAGPAPRRGEHDDARPLPRAARGGGAPRRPAQVLGQRHPPAGRRAPSSRSSTRRSPPRSRAGRSPTRGGTARPGAISWSRRSARTSRMLRPQASSSSRGGARGTARWTSCCREPAASPRSRSRAGGRQPRNPGSPPSRPRSRASVRSGRCWSAATGLGSSGSCSSRRSAGCRDREPDPRVKAPSVRAGAVRLDGRRHRTRRRDSTWTSDLNVQAAALGRLAGRRAHLPGGPPPQGIEPISSREPIDEVPLGQPHRAATPVAIGADAGGRRTRANGRFVRGYRLGERRRTPTRALKTLAFGCGSSILPRPTSLLLARVRPLGAMGRRYEPMRPRSTASVYVSCVRTAPGAWWRRSGRRPVASPVAIGAGRPRGGPHEAPGGLAGVLAQPANPVGGTHRRAPVCRPRRRIQRHCLDCRRALMRSRSVEAVRRMRSGA